MISVADMLTEWERQWGVLAIGHQPTDTYAERLLRDAAQVIRDAITEIRRLREEHQEAHAHFQGMQARTLDAEDALAAHQAVMRELAETLEQSDEPGQAQEEECARWLARKDAALAHPLVQQAREEKAK